MIRRAFLKPVSKEWQSCDFKSIELPNVLLPLGVSMSNYLTIEKTDNGFVVKLNDYSGKGDGRVKGTWVARSNEELKEVLQKHVYPVLESL